MIKDVVDTTEDVKYKQLAKSLENTQQEDVQQMCDSNDTKTHKYIGTGIQLQHIGEQYHFEYNAGGQMYPRINRLKSLHRKDLETDDSMVNKNK